jgi:multiple sugar transport system permease protein
MALGARSQHYCGSWSAKMAMSQGQQGTQWNYLMADATISMLAGLVLTILMHRYIFKSIAISSGFGGH